ncbi:MAG: 16S rRNA processing protein RimM [Acidimicrobiia bacterium]|nr:16S rRNA processing protein RimM [Acidimicrobiia bacterium]
MSPAPPAPGNRADGTGWDEMVLVGRVARPHGLRGQVVINPETDFVEERFREGARVWLRTPGGVEARVVASMRVWQGRPIVRFEGAGTCEDAEQLVGQELRVSETALQPLGEGVFYHHQLVGCAVETVDGETIGHVTRVDGGTGTPCLVVGRPRGEALVPLAADICVDVDVAGRRIRVDPPEGLLELNDR